MGERRGVNVAAGAKLRGADLVSASDDVLLSQTRQGDSRAFAELWSRHVASARAAARSVTQADDPDDIVSEAFTRILQAIRDGHGPRFAFRPYLLATVRNVAVTRGRTRAETSLDEAGDIASPVLTETVLLESFNSSVVSKAYKTLPRRWQEVLWYSEVEQMRTSEVGTLLGVPATNVPTLAYRAREGLRQAWVQAHISATSPGAEHRWVLEQLGRYTRDAVTPARRARIDQHLDECSSCRDKAAEARTVGASLSVLLLGLVLGSGASAYALWMGAGASPASAAPALGADPTTGSSSVGSSSASGASSSAFAGASTSVLAGSLTAAAAVAVVAAIVVSGVFADSSPGSPGAADVSALASPSSPPQSGEDADSAQPADEGASTPGSPSAASAVAPETALSSPTETSNAAGAAEQTPDAVSEGTTPEGNTQTGDSTPSNPSAPADSPSSTPSAPATADTVSVGISTVDTGASGALFPIISGRAPAGTSLVLLNDEGTVLASTSADNTDSFTLTASSGLPIGVSTVTISYTTPEDDSGQLTTHVEISPVSATATVVYTEDGTPSVSVVVNGLDMHTVLHVYADGEDTGLVATDGTVDLSAVDAALLTRLLTAQSLTTLPVAGERQGPQSALTVIVATPQAFTDTGELGAYYPILSGSAEPGSPVAVSYTDRDGAASTVTLSASASGYWTTEQLETTNEVTVTFANGSVETIPVTTYSVTHSVSGASRTFSGLVSGQLYEVTTPHSEESSYLCGAAETAPESAEKAFVVASLDGTITVSTCWSGPGVSPTVQAVDSQDSPRRVGAVIPSTYAG